MENASKALNMAASVLIAIVIISAFVLMMSNLTSYQQKSYDTELTAQVAEFNNQFMTYARDDIRGSDMISLMNRIADYNTRYAGTEGYTPMEVDIDMNGINEKLFFDTNEGNKLVIKSHYDETNIYEIVGKPTLTTIDGSGGTSSDITGGIIREIENKYQQKYCNQLASEIDNIRRIVDGSGTPSDKVKAFDAEKILPQSATSYYKLVTDPVAKIYDDALVYYEYIQFKRTYFDCIGNPQYDEDTGRVLKLEFKCTGVGV